MVDFKERILVEIDGIEHECFYSEWLTWKGKEASGYSCQVDKNTSLSSPTLEGLMEKIMEHKPYEVVKDGAWYGEGRYMGD